MLISLSSSCHCPYQVSYIWLITRRATGIPMALPKPVRAAPRLKYGVFARVPRGVVTGELIEETYSRCAHRRLTSSRCDRLGKICKYRDDRSVNTTSGRSESKDRLGLVYWFIFQEPVMLTLPKKDRCPRNQTRSTTGTFIIPHLGTRSIPRYRLLTA